MKSWSTVSRHAEFITSPRETANVMRRAMHHLRSGTPGPVVVELPQDIVGQEIPDNEQTYSSPKIMTSVPSVSDIRDAAASLISLTEGTLVIILGEL